MSKYLVVCCDCGKEFLAPCDWKPEYNDWFHCKECTPGFVARVEQLKKHYKAHPK